MYIHSSYLWDSCHIRINFHDQFFHPSSINPYIHKLWKTRLKDVKKFREITQQLSILSNLFRVNDSRVITNDSHWIPFDRSSRRYIHFNFSHFNVNRVQKEKKKKENNIFQEFFFQELIINDSIRLTLTKNRFPSFLIYYQISCRGIASNANLRGK